MPVVAFCPACGTKNEPGNAFCPVCGFRLLRDGSPAAGESPPAPFCPACGQPNEPRTAFCLSCGWPLTGEASAPSSQIARVPDRASPPVSAALPVRPADFSTMFAGTFRVFFANSWAFLLPYFLFGLLVNLGLFLVISPDLVQALFNPALLATDPSLGQSLLRALPGLLILDVVVGLVGDAILRGSLSYLAVERHRGRPVHLSHAFGRGLRRFVSVIAATILLGLLLLLLSAVAFALLLFSAALGPLALVCFGLGLLLVFLVVVVIVLVGTSLYVPAIVVEGVGALEGLLQSWDLSKGHRWSLFGTYLAVGFLALLVAEALSLAAIGSGSIVLVLLANAAASALAVSWILIAESVAYDLLSRRRPTIEDGGAYLSRSARS